MGINNWLDAADTRVDDGKILDLGDRKLIVLPCI